MLAPDIAAACRHGLDAQLLNQAAALDDPAALNAWLDSLPADHYPAALRIHAHLLTTRNTIRTRSNA